MAATNVVNVVVHSFVADSSLLDCCDLVVCVFSSSTLCLQLGHRLRFEVVSAVLFVSFGVSCLLA